MEPKAKTIIERHGFKDNDRKKLSHDEIQIWVYRNFVTILKQVFPDQILDESLPLDLRLEYAVCDSRFNNVVGFIDVYSIRLAIAIEVKTEIPVIGDLIRQIQFYRKYMFVRNWIVVSPDDRPAAILKEQDISFFKYKRTGELF